MQEEKKICYSGSFGQQDLCNKRHFHRISCIRYPAPAPAGGKQDFEYPAEGNILQISDPDIGSGRPLGKAAKTTVFNITT